jgi:ribonuclease HI
MKKTIYTDGACSGNPGKGGWAIVVVDGEKVEVRSGNEKFTTNNRMELIAFIECLKYILTNPDNDFVIKSDSKYVVDGFKSWLPHWIKKDWKGSDNKPVKNQDLWKEINRISANIKFKLEWTKGHAKDKYNEMADNLAVEARDII